MKFVVMWKPRSAAISREESVARVLEMFEEWTVPADETIYQFVGRLDGSGGLAVVETDNPDSLADPASKFSPYLEFDIFPVNDIAWTARTDIAGVEFRKSIGQPGSAQGEEPEESSS